MSSGESAPRIELDIGPSPSGLTLVAAMLALGLAGIWLSGVGHAAAGLLTLGLGVFVFRALRRDWLPRAPGRVAGLVWRPSGVWMLRTGTGDWLDDCDLESRTVHPLLTLLTFRCPDGKRRTALLLPDNACRRTVRRLRARLSLVS